MSSVFKFMSVIIFLSRILLGLVSSRIFFLWIRIEVNLAAFLGLILTCPRTRALRKIKYFLAQRVGRFLILGGAVYRVTSLRLREIFLALGLRLKLGAVPFHGWILNLCNHFSLRILWILLIVQKILPLLLGQVLGINFIMYFILIGSAIVGALGCKQVTQVKKLIGYISLFRASWLLLICVSPYLVIIYLVVAGAGLAGLMAYYRKFSQNLLKAQKFSTNQKIESVYLITSMFSLVGVPPFFGFYVKVLMILFIRAFYEAINLIILLLLTNALLFYYILINYYELICGRTRGTLLAPSKSSYLRVFIFLINSPLVLVFLL